MGNSVNSNYIVIEGVLCELHVEFGKKDLLAKINRHYRGQSAIAGLAAVASDLYGQVANSAMLAMYDGDETQNFMCLIDGQVVCGQFAGAEWLKPGNRVKAVVQQIGDVLVAAGILDEKQGFAWIHHPYGSRAELMANFKLGFGLFLFVSIFFGAGIFVYAGWNANSQVYALKFVLATAVLTGGVALWSSKDMRALSAPSTQIFRLLGFQDPERVNLNPYTIKAIEIKDYINKGTQRPASMDMAQGRTRNVYVYQRAIDDGKVRLAA